MATRRRDLRTELVLARVGATMQLETLIGALPSRRLREGLYRRVLGLRLAPDAKLHRRAEITVARGVEIGAGSVIGQDVFIDGRGGVQIGANVNFAGSVAIYTFQHDTQAADFAVVGAPVRIEDRVWLSFRSTVLPGVTVGEGAVVAAHAVVTKDVEPYTMVGGVPAKPIGTRPRGLTYELAADRAPWFI